MRTGRLKADLFWSHVRKTRGCWWWTASLQNRGYGQVRSGPRTLLAHRVSYELVVGPIPKGKELDHLCRNRSCVNPKHLEPVTSRTNTHRGLLVALKRTCAQGHPWTRANIAIVGKHRRRRCLICERARTAAAGRRRRAIVAGRQWCGRCLHSVREGMCRCQGEVRIA